MPGIVPLSSYWQNVHPALPKGGWRHTHRQTHTQHTSKHTQHTSKHTQNIQHTSELSTAHKAHSQTQTHRQTHSTHSRTHTHTHARKHTARHAQVNRRTTRACTAPSTGEGPVPLWATCVHCVGAVCKCACTVCGQCVCAVCGQCVCAVCVHRVWAVCVLCVRTAWAVCRQCVCATCAVSTVCAVCVQQASRRWAGRKRETHTPAHGNTAQNGQSHTVAHTLGKKQPIKLHTHARHTQDMHAQAHTPRSRHTRPTTTHAHTARCAQAPERHHAPCLGH
jgi:hypothetical protein